jgi:hypothetical protein
VEAYNNKLQVFFAEPHPKIIKSIRVFQEVEKTAQLMYFRALSDKPVENTKRRSKVIKDKVLRLYKRLLKEKSITLEVYILKLQGLFDIFKQTHKEKEDAEESESEEDSEDDSDDSDGEYNTHIMY